MRKCIKENYFQKKKKLWQGLESIKGLMFIVVGLATKMQKWFY